MTADNVIVSGLEAPCPALEGAVRSHNGKLYHCNGREWTEQGGGSSSGPKVYRALLSQSGTDAPVATVLENTLGGTPVWSRLDVGKYACTLANGFPMAKTAPLFYIDTWNGNASNLSQLNFIDDQSFRLYALDITPGFVELGGTQTFVQILVYP